MFEILGGTALTPPTASDVTELLALAHRLLYRLMLPLLRAEGLTVSEVLVMKCVAGGWETGREAADGPGGAGGSEDAALRGEAPAGYRLTDLSRQVGLPPSTLTAVIDRLEAMGYLVRTPSPADRRSVLVRPTERWREVWRRLRARRDGEMAAVLAALGPEQVARLAADLEALVAALRERQADRARGEG